MATCYLEPDDEVTSAIGRIRAVADKEAVIVVPPGSRIATSRINFKLLVREAAERDMTVVAVSDDPAVRALAISAGLPAYDSLAAGEHALATFREQDRRLAERLGDGGAQPQPGQRPPGGRDETLGQTRVLPVPPLPADARRGSDTAVLPPEVAAAGAARRRRSRRRIPIAPLLVIGLLALLVAGVAYGAYVFLPTASITLRPTPVELDVPAFAVTADPNVAVVDVDAGVIPAENLSVPLHVSGTFTSTGVAVRETRATGSVRFRSENTVADVPVNVGTVVSTPDGIEFETTEAVTVPRADFATSTPGVIDAKVRAVRPGERGNVGAGTITGVPAALNSQLVSVRNPEPISGGARIEETAVSQEDYDTAYATLNSRLQPALVAALADPGNVPRGLVVFPTSAQIGDAQPDPTADMLVGNVTPTFDLSLDATAQVVAVNESLLDDVATARLRAQLEPGQQLVGDQIKPTHDAGTVVGQTVIYQVAANALAYHQPDPAQVVDQVRGKSVTEAQSVLSQYGTAEISVWPEFVDHLPDQAARINLTVVPPVSAS